MYCNLPFSSPGLPLFIYFFPSFSFFSCFCTVYSVRFHFTTQNGSLGAVARQGWAQKNIYFSFRFLHKYNIFAWLLRLSGALLRISYACHMRWLWPYFMAAATAGGIMLQFNSPRKVAAAQLMKPNFATPFPEIHPRI